MKLTDTQSLLLAHAAQCDSGSLYPLPTTLTSKAGAARSIVSLVKAGLAEERETSVVAAIVRQDGDLGYGMFVTADGLAAIGVDDSAGEQIADEAEALPTPAPRTSKIAGVLELLGRDDSRADHRHRLAAAYDTCCSHWPAQEGTCACPLQA